MQIEYPRCGSLTKLADNAKHLLHITAFIALFRKMKNLHTMILEFFGEQIDRIVVFYSHITSILSSLIESSTINGKNVILLLILLGKSA